MTPAELQARKALPTNVPCNGCRACCKQDAVPVTDGESDRFAWHLERGKKVLDRKANGECVYLGPSGCSVHTAPPDICKRFDCRVLFLTTPKAQRRIRIEQNPTMQAVYQAGKRRISTLD